MASFNEGTLEEVKAKADVSLAQPQGKTATVPAANHTFDTSTSAYLFDLAIEKNEDPDFKQAVLERHKHFHIGGMHPLSTFSLRFGTVNDTNSEAEQPARLWAQRHVVAKEPYYVISASPLDMHVDKEDRSEHYLGKLKESYGARCFTGFSCAKDKSVQSPTVCVIYDHERAAGEHKMEVGVPLPGERDPCSASLEQDFHRVRREGAQNHPAPPCWDAPPPVRFFHQKNDAADVMRCEQSLLSFVLGDSACATRTSTKNFQLVLSRPSRANMMGKAPPQEQQDHNETPAGGSSLEESAGAEEGEGAGEDEKVLLQMGKLDDDLFSVAYKAPFTLLQTFMICLSRFETKQAY